MIFTKLKAKRKNTKSVKDEDKYDDNDVDV